MTDNREIVKDYYANVTTEKEGQLASSVCSCANDNLPANVKAILAEVPDEVITRFYGCGSPIPTALEGCTVLDLGCGTGRDCYVVSKLVGESGKVIGVDMTDEQLEIARKYQDEMANKFGFKASNIEFKKGFIEDLALLGIEDESIDIVISNCVINLSSDKEKVFKEIWRVLKPGGELYFSDIFADRRVPEEISKHPLLVGECLGGAMYIEDFRRMLQSIGWKDFRYMVSHIAEINNEEIEALVENITFSSRTVRAFKLPGLIEDICEQYGQFATYLGGIESQEFAFDLDDHHHFEKGLPMAVCGNTCAMVENTRFAKYFQIHGDRSHHYGPFPGCGNAPDVLDGSTSACVGGCCC